MTTDVVISFDTTGSMSPCIAEVRRRVSETIDVLFDSISDLRISIVSHGDYCDMGKAFSLIDFTDDRRALIKFINDAPNTSGGDADEFYEYVLNQISFFDWQADHRAIILIGDAMPHEVGYRYGSIINPLDWRNEAQILAGRRISIYTVQALGRRGNHVFYEALADMTNGRKLDLNQFADAVETIIAISIHSTGNLEHLDAYRVHLEGEFKMNRNLASVFNRLAGWEVEVKADYSGLVPVPPYRFQILHVDHPVSIREFVESNGATFKKGRGFYQFTKTETVQEYKEVILRNKYNGDMFTGAEAREFIGLPFGTRGYVRPGFFDDYEVYIQSTSYNRKLMPNTKFLYENE